MPLKSEPNVEMLQIFGSKCTSVTYTRLYKKKNIQKFLHKKTHGGVDQPPPYTRDRVKNTNTRGPLIPSLIIRPYTFV